VIENSPVALFLDNNVERRRPMHGRLSIFSFMVTIFLAGLAAPILAESAKEATLLTAMVAEGANIWLPSTLIVNKGDEVKLTLRNVAKAEHGFSIDELGIKEVIPPGETKVVTMTPKEKGVLRYYCQLHKGHVGGQLLVRMED
jgi:plastocyanin